MIEFVIGLIFGSSVVVIFLVGIIMGFRANRKDMTPVLQEKISVLEERLKLAAEITASKNTIIHDKNRRINELEVELKKAKDFNRDRQD